MNDHKEQYLKSMQAASSGTSLESLLQASSAIGDLKNMWEDMADAAPDEIQSDTEAVRDAWIKIEDAATSSNWKSALSTAVLNAGSLSRVDQYVRDNCDAVGSNVDRLNVIKEGKLTVCTSLPYEPFEVEKSGEIVGFDIDLAHEIAKANDLELDFLVTGFEGIQSGQILNSGKCDLAAAGMTITDERKQAIDFTDPYFDADQALLTKDASLDSLDSLDGKVLAVTSGTTGEDYAEENAPEGVTIKSFEDLALQTSALTAGTVDAVMQDNGLLLDYAKKNPGTQVTTEFDTGEQYGMAVKKDANDDLLDSANKVLADLKDSGDYDTIYKKWFGKAPTASQ